MTLAHPSPTCHPKRVILARATWTEVDALDRESVVVIPVGGTEQHGPSLPLGTSTIVAEAVAQALHDRLGDDVLVAPTIPYAVSGGESAFPGTVDLGYEAFAAVLRAVVASFARHRFRSFLFLPANTSDGNAAIRTALRTIKNESPKLQLARLVAGLGPQGRGEMLLATQPDLIRDIPDLATRRLMMETESAMEACFITDTDELFPQGFQFVNHEDALANGEENLAQTIRRAVKLVGTMREGRVYVERDLTEEKETI